MYEQHTIFINNKPRNVFKRELSFGEIVALAYPGRVIKTEDFSKHKIMVPTPIGKLKMIPLEQDKKVIVIDNMMIGVERVE